MEATQFASAERSSPEEAMNALVSLSSLNDLMIFFNSVAGIAAILDKNRQIIYANNEYLVLLGIDSIEHIIGKRPGESVSCIHADENENGCGCAEACRYCGAISAVLESQKTGKPAKKDTRLTLSRDNTTVNLDLRVSASPLLFKNIPFTVITLTDISNEKRKENLERIFFHDTSNLALSINSGMNILKDMPDKNEGSEIITLTEKASIDLLDEINSYKQLTLAENNDLAVLVSPVIAFEIIQDSINKAMYLEVASQITIRNDSPDCTLSFNTDRSLLSRILINMLKNACEASHPGDSVSIRFDFQKSSTITFSVQNPSFISREAQLQIFQRSYSTKGINRGLGTYSIKLLGEKYLGGSVGFSSTEDSGTKFYITLPI
jgi:signal transduction histidine kinase